MRMDEMAAYIISSLSMHHQQFWTVQYNGRFSSLLDLFIGIVSISFLLVRKNFKPSKLPRR
jgi:hypothetical protein